MKKRIAKENYAGLSDNTELLVMTDLSNENK